MSTHSRPIARLFAALLAGATIAAAIAPDLAAAQDRGRAERPDDRREARQSRGGEERATRRDARAELAPRADAAKRAAQRDRRVVVVQRAEPGRDGRPRTVARPPLDGRDYRPVRQERHVRDHRYSDRDDRQVRWNNDWRRDYRYDWRNHRTRYASVYRLPRYYAPYAGRGYHRFNVGFTLRNGYFHNRYWISDPWRYRLPAVYGPYRWVRYYGDVLLIDTRYGRVVDVIHDFFY